MIFYWPTRIYKSLRFRLLNYLAKRRSRPIFKAATRLVLERQRRTTVRSESPLNERLSVLLSYRITEPERLRILEVVAAKTGESLAGQNLTFLVHDSSDEAQAVEAKKLLEAVDLPLRYENVKQKLAPAYSEMLGKTRSQYFYLQFDDQLTAGLTPGFLESCCDLLDKYEGLINVIPIMWPHAVSIDEGSRCVQVTNYRVAAGAGDRLPSYHFGYGKPQTPLFIEEFGGYRFGIFENFNYGFFFNHLVAPVEDYRERLEWYRQNVSSESVHAIEMAAEHCTLGPFWTHVAICLSNVCLLDLDYAHTPSAVRPQGGANRASCDALAAGYGLKVSSL